MTQIDLKGYQFATCGNLVIMAHPDKEPYAIPADDLGRVFTGLQGAFRIKPAAVERLPDRELIREAAQDDASNIASEAEARFWKRYSDDKAEDMSKEAWGEWVDALPKDEFMAMISIGVGE